MRQAFALYARGRPEEALERIRSVTAGRPPDPETLNLTAACHQGLGRPEQAGACWRQALALRPDFVSAWNNLGVLAKERNDFRESLAAYREALRIQPDYVSAWYNLGVLLQAMGELEEGAAAFREVMRLDPGHVAARNNLGNIARDRGRFPEAEAAFRQALALQPDCADAQWNLSLLLLTLGAFQEGWRLHEARHHPNKTQWRVPLPALPFPRWRGEELEGRSLLLVGEQGMGDQIQFCRFAPLLKARGVRRLTLVCPPALLPLFASLEGVDRVVDEDRLATVAPQDYWALLHSIPHLAGTGIPSRLPYLAPPAGRLQAWRERLAPARGMRVGVVWKGDPSHGNDAHRSLPDLTVLAPLWRVPGVTMISLQKGRGEEEARHPPPGQPVTHLGEALTDWGESAAAVMALDLLISIDSAVAHLAGALGKRCWVMLPARGCDWRWMLEREDSPWYPEVMRLFRQTRPGVWSDVVERMVAELAGAGNGHDSAQTNGVFPVWRGSSGGGAGGGQGDAGHKPR
ncbi:MAG: glycosyltransferase family protein [Magnetococcales bacterium]|nr:glycosyltransferase family protein [Magnetococcales bacterium]